ncbi:hypothetical protein A7X75_06235 [Stenotrophomonas maltophilia]|nr:hypothetical protein A7X75_06235 [Stenotrophomonas maltophilia]
MNMSGAIKVTKWWVKLLSSVSALTWLFLLVLWGAVTFNRNTDNSLGIYELSALPGVEVLFWVCFFGQPLLTVVMFIRMALRHRFALFELPLAIVVWGLFLYNLSFFRG